MKWSLSRLQCYEKCGAQYRFRYIENLPSDFKSPAAARGQALHSVMEEFILGNRDHLPEELSYYTQFASSLKEEDRFVKFPEKKMALTNAWEPCDWDHDEAWWRGILDLLIEHPDGVIIYDWKTGKIYDDHIQQRELYALASFSHYPHIHEVRAIHVYLDQRQNRETVFSRDQIPQLRGGWEERVARMVSDDELIPKPGFYCRFCAYARDKGGPCQF